MQPIYNAFILPKERKELASALEMPQVVLCGLNCNVWKDVCDPVHENM